MKRQKLISAEPLQAENLAEAVPGALVITAQQLAPEQKLFNQLLGKIQAASQALQKLSDLANSHRAQCAKRFLPLQKEQCALQTQMVLVLDQRLQDPKGLSKPVRAYIAEAVCSLAAELFNSPDGVQMRAVYERHAASIQSGDESGATAAADAMQDMMSQVFGIDLDDDGQLESPEQVLAAALRKIQEQQEHDAARLAKRKKSAKQLAAEREILDGDKVLRDIYRKLASAMHPDREPDAIERKRKTALMVEVNVAYEKKDLLALLQLQLKAEQIDPESVSAMAEDKLRHFNRILQGQASSLQLELRQAERMFRGEFELSYGPITTKLMDTALRFQLNGYEGMIGQMKADIVQIQDDKGLKRWVQFQKLLDSDGDDFDGFGQR